MQVGTFKINSGKVFVSDPCYNVDTWCAGSIEKVKKGNWYADVIMSDEGNWGTRVAVLIARHESVKAGNDDTGWMEQKFEVGVDSGQAGIFDYPEFRGGDDDGWYNDCCKLTLDTELSAGIIEKSGVVSSSGVGDGGYTCSTITKNDEVVAIKIDFGLLNDEEDEEENEEERGYKEAEETED